MSANDYQQSILDERNQRIAKFRRQGYTIFKIAGIMKLDYHQVMEVLIEMELNVPRQHKSTEVHRKRRNIRHSVEEHQALLESRQRERELWG